MHLDEPFDWHTSGRANQTCKWFFLNSTVFPHGAGFKHVINVDGADREDAVFSAPFLTESEAIEDAERQMRALLEAALARRR